MLAYWPTMAPPSRATQISGPVGGHVRVAAVLPVPAQPVGVGHVGAEHAAVQRLDLAPVVGSVAVDLSHRASLSPPQPARARTPYY